MVARKFNVAVCLFPNVTALDYQGPMELFGFLGPSKDQNLPPETQNVTLHFTYLSHTKQNVIPKSGPPVVPESTYDDELHNQYDILLVPGGPGARPGGVPDELLNFLKVQAPGAQYVLSVCTGAWVLAGAGLLDGKRATTNKSAFRSCQEATSKEIEWVAKARWVVCGNYWTSSGVTAGQDMANAFIEHLVGEPAATAIRGIVELSKREQDDDEFAEYYGLI